jgi:inner membrane protein
MQARAEEPLRKALTLAMAELAALGIILVIDAHLLRHAYARPVQAILDEPAHLFTALIILAALRTTCLSPFWLSATLASVFIDLDHVPGELGYTFLQYGEPRPYTHSLLVAGCFLLLGLWLTGISQQIARGIAAGMVLHFIRDIVTAGLPLFWPAVTRGIQLPYVLYPVTLFAFAVLGVFVDPAA